MNTTIQHQAQLFKTLMHPLRIAILELLRDDEACVCHLEAHLDVRQAALSQQLAILRKADLIADRRNGLYIFYRIVQPDVVALLDTARTMVVDSSSVGTLPVGAPRDCPCPKCMCDTVIVDESRLRLTSS